ncbi:fluoride efflux transporter CrcB [Psychrobacillus lasiicapitis]|uniref:Fluoride-specific ion channel FluC n=1 Tax=Psychrobacillus lasiicapitis TaxID=1636719 RepID=A0A544T935_9BACI|nr:fluoride efflux transporter CrcB [Psychrobacillus lasiicapitis]TQR13961.1 fluoride efflux transporter CrcB [Psychrobacillus lasiicapitis]GGA36977.1 chromosome condensation protein CrcB [Psychrobacillus lasiicapitis]
MSVYYMLAVGAGGFLGAITRYYISQKLNKAESDRLPIGTLTVNLLGSFLLGFILSVGLKDIYTLLIGTGFLGAFTTFSTLHKELFILQKYPRKWLIYFVVTYSGGLVFAFIGYLLGK